MKAMLNSFSLNVSLRSTVYYEHEAWHGVYKFIFFSVNTMLDRHTTDTHWTTWKIGVDTHLVVRRTAQRHTCKDCGKKHWGPRSQRNRAACPVTPGRANHTAAVELEGEVAEVGWAAGGSGTGAKALSGYSPSSQTERSEKRQADKWENQWRYWFQKNTVKPEKGLLIHFIETNKALVLVEWGSQHRGKANPGSTFTTICNITH